MVRLYAQVVGLSVVLVGVVGLVVGNDPILGVLNVDRAEDGIHLLTGGLMALAGFVARDLRVVRVVVGGLGFTYLAVGVLGIFAPHLFGLIPHGYDTVLDNLIHLALGLAGIVVGFVLSDRRTAARRA